MNMYIERSYRTDQGEFGTKRIIQFGRCDGSQETIAAVENGVTTSYELIQWPNARGVTLKALDGIVPSVVEIAPPTMSGRKYSCVKIGAKVTPFAALQPGGVFEGSTVLEYEIIWQQVGAVP